MSEKIVTWLIRQEVIEEDDRELYLYALKSLVMLVIPVFIALFMACLISRLSYGIMLIFPFLFLRKFSGGYHMKHFSSCLMTSTLLLFLYMKMGSYITCHWILWVLTILAAISLSIFSPIENENRPLDDEEKMQYKKITRILVLLFLLFDFLIFAIKQFDYSIYFSLGIQLSAVLQLPCIIKKLYLKTKNKEKLSFHS